MAHLSNEELATRVVEVVMQRIDARDLNLPPMPAVAVRCLETLSKPDFSISELVRGVETDPLMAARVVRLANSAARATLEPARSVIQAVTRLGADELRSFIIEISARPIFESHDQKIGEMGRALWTHSVAVALLARAIVRRAGGQQPEAAYLAGLLHDVGKPLMAFMLLEAERRLFKVKTRKWLVHATWLTLIERTHRKLGIALSQAWRLPDLVVKTVTDSAALDAAGARSPANAVCLGNALAKDAGLYAGEVDRAVVDPILAEGRALFGLGDQDIKSLTNGLRDRVEERLS